ncbi:MAG: FAD/NAD(P)-binding protein [Actinobacteria bacterium]|nr:FAD/NAD(P)-binding protein [Actinomycetota bacterium]
MERLEPAPERPPADVGLPLRVATIRRVVPETPDTSTYWLTLADPAERARFRFEPGQFDMLTVPGVGESAISISSDPAHPERLAHTVRAVGRVTRALGALGSGDRIGLRGPFGRPWPMAEAEGGDLLIVAGGLGLAPVRPAIFRAMRARDRYRRVVVLIGARGPEHLLFGGEFDGWGQWMRDRELEVALSVDVPTDDWPYGVGVVTTLFDGARIEPQRTTALVCGPEIMMCFAAHDLVVRGMSPDRIHVCIERNMQCGVRLCGHCQLGPLFVCSDGPVFPFGEVVDHLEAGR